MEIRPVTLEDRDHWLRMRSAQWPGNPGDHAGEIDAFLSGSRAHSETFLAIDDAGEPCGFIEVGTRPYAEGCASSPVGYIEGWWVDPGYRGAGVGAALVMAAENWARELGMTEMASDTALDNRTGEVAHRALGYEETDRLICFRKRL